MRLFEPIEFTIPLFDIPYAIGASIDHTLLGHILGGALVTFTAALFWQWLSRTDSRTAIIVGALFSMGMNLGIEFTDGTDVATNPNSFFGLLDFTVWSLATYAVYALLLRGKLSYT